MSTSDRPDPSGPQHEGRVGRRAFLGRLAWGGVLAPVGALLAGCGGSTPSSAPSQAATDGPAAPAGPGRRADVLVLHHALGLTDGMRALAQRLGATGHTVHLPDLYGGRTFPTLEEGVAFAQELGFQELVDRGVRAAQALPDDLVYVGVSLGVLPAQKLAQTRRGARGAALLEACAPVDEYADRWPAAVPVQVHGMTDDPFFSGEGDVENARALVEEADDGRLFVYPGDQHLFTDSSQPSYDAAATDLVVERVLDLLDR